MKVKLTRRELRAAAEALARLLSRAECDGVELPTAVTTAWLKLVRAQAQQVTVPTPDAASLPVHSLPGVGTVDDTAGEWGFR